MAKRRKTDEPTSYIVRMKCTVIKDVVCDNCTEEQATSNPWEFAIDEIEIDQTDWEVTDIKANV